MKCNMRAYFDYADLQDADVKWLEKITGFPEDDGEVNDL